MERFSEYDPDEFSIGSERESEMYDPDLTFDSERASESTVGDMGPPLSVHALVQKNAGLELEINELLRQIRILKFQVEEITKQRDTFKEENAKQRDALKEADAVHIKYEVVKQRLADLTRELPNQGGTRKNKRIKHVSKYSTASKNNASRRYSSKR